MRVTLGVFVNVSVFFRLCSGCVCVDACCMSQREPKRCREPLIHRPDYVCRSERIAVVKWITPLDIYVFSLSFFFFLFFICKTA